MRIVDRRGEPDAPEPEVVEPEKKPEVREVVPLAILQAKCECGQVCSIYPQEVVGRFLRDGAFNLTCPPCPDCGTVIRMVHPQKPKIVVAQEAVNRQTRRRIEAAARRASR